MYSQLIARRILKVILVPIVASCLLVALFGLMMYAPVHADDDTKPAGGGYPLIVGTSTNFSTVGIHDVFEVDVANNMSQSLLTLFPVWGATYDAANNRVLFTSSQGSAATVGDQLWELPLGGSLNNLGTIMDATGAPQRIDGLAISGGVLYGSVAGASADDGIWTVNTSTLVATQVFPFSDSVSGIDADPNTGTIYGVNDTTASLVEIDPGAMTMTTVTAYPGGQTDIDGLAIGDDGRAYLVTDEPGSFFVYNLSGGAYETPLTSPWTAADTFSGAAFVTQMQAPSIVMTKTVGSDPNTCATSNNLAVSSGGGGTVVGYCYTVMNTGDVTLTLHDLDDSELGNIFTGFPYALAPGASIDTVTAGQIVSALITQTTTNVATWTAYVGKSSFVTATSTATVTVLPPTSVSLTDFGGGADSTPLALAMLLLLLIGIGAVLYRKRFA